MGGCGGWRLEELRHLGRSRPLLPRTPSSQYHFTLQLDARKKRKEKEQCGEGRGPADSFGSSVSLNLYSQ